MKTSKLFLLIAVVLGLPESADAATEIRRHLLAVGANHGGEDRVTLKYAVSDAERFAGIMVGMGGVSPSDHVVLDQPEPSELKLALQDLAAKLSHSGSPAERTELLFYYSGHADESGLRVGGGHLSYSELRSLIEAVPASVRITVLDACASGAITRLKGGERRKPFLIDESSSTQGYAFLTSSSENEAAQESDAIQGSFFTHYLVSGLRGAADMSGDGRISLTEAYQFAFHETLAKTTETLGGAQHPSYAINLSGTGDVVMTDVRRTSAGLVLAKDLQGRFFIRDKQQHLVAELYKPRGQRMTLGLEPGVYRVHFDQDPQLFVANVELGLEELLVLEPGHFETADRVATVVRGDGPWPPRPGFMGPLVGRSRVQLMFGWNSSGLKDDDLRGAVSNQASTEHTYVGVGYGRWVREDIALGLDFYSLAGRFTTDIGPGVVNMSHDLTSIRISARKYMPQQALKTPVRPFLLLGVGALIGNEDRTEVLDGEHNSSKSFGAFGPELGAGVDLILGRRLMLGSKISYNLVTDFSETIGGKKNHSGAEFGISLGWLWGRAWGQ